MNIGHIPAKAARFAPDRPALIDVPNNRRMSFGELDFRVRKLANGLTRELGLKRGDRVAMLSRNCIEFMELYYAAARVGLIVQPLNWRLSAGEMARIVEDAEPGALVFSQEFKEVADTLRDELDLPHWLSLGDDGRYEALIAAASDEEPAVDKPVGDDDPMMILYTGGTTGRSKGALHTHRSVFAGMINQTVAERVQRDDVYMLTGQMFHIPVVLAMNYMAHGCPVVLINFEARLALEVIERERVSAFLGVTTMLNWMMAVDDFADFDLSSLRNIQYGGGPMPRKVVEAALEAFPCTIIQGYGQTEGMTMSFLAQEDHLAAVNGTHPERLASCGRESFMTTLRVIDANGNDVPRDNSTPGEIIVQSEGNMVEYWRQPDQTAETLKDGWLYTGDIATWDEEGYIFIVDRAKDMIISGGENIFSTQVEAAIHQHPAVLESAVFGVPDDQWGEAVKAVVVLKPGMQATEQEIIQAASQHLASYQKPRSVDFVDSLPKAPTGKILKRDLREPYWQKSDKNV
ncbi:AMP-dependent synthetase and ligase [Luminiphilus syltensis NOR5-1B]|uniref:AMP-dependent synthetase and ligase n=1 Tax=Luminiphilus syltensis NOR5-1B TaxID=565045 RepID=B8KQG7_9GAMM|nr:AMP-binding protein [Luminiphilus syltensis]EED34154.1 AMP-dependent synthetase and ligase [Luminiphilus syltensis NOR5-1B]